MDFFEKTLKSETKFKGRIIEVVVEDIELSDGSKSTREIVKHNGGVCVLVLDDENNVYFVKQFRSPYKEVLLEVPAGKLEIGEDPFEAVKREQREETGTVGKNYVYLGDLYPTPGYCGEVIRIWACRIDGFCDTDLDEGEFVEVEKIPFEKALEMVMNNEIPDAKTQIAILKTAILLQNSDI
ncbi:MAG: NUDIX hydrolase [Clostridia bacterium]